jgi:hypothetical protein
MSALLVDELTVAAPSMAPQWRRVEPSADAFGGPQAELFELHPVSAPGAVPALTGRPGSLRLTDRGIAVVLTLFVGLFLVGAAVVVSGFFAVSDAPISHQQAPQSVAVGVAG